MQEQKTPRRWCASGQESTPASVLRRAFAWSGVGPWLARSPLVRRTSTSRSVDLVAIWTANSPPVPVMALDLPAIVTHTWWVVIVCKEHAYGPLLFFKVLLDGRCQPKSECGVCLDPKVGSKREGDTWELDSCTSCRWEQCRIQTFFGIFWREKYFLLPVILEIDLMSADVHWLTKVLEKLVLI